MRVQHQYRTLAGMAAVSEARDESTNRVGRICRHTVSERRSS